MKICEKEWKEKNTCKTHLHEVPSNSLPISLMRTHCDIAKRSFRESFSGAYIHEYSLHLSKGMVEMQSRHFDSIC